MEFLIEKNSINDIINTVQKAVSPKSTMQILECIKIDADMSGSIKFTGNNLELCIEYISECTVKEGGSTAIDSKMLGEIVRKLPDGIVHFEINDENNIIKITSGKSEFNIQGLNADDFPQSPEFNEKYKLTIPQNTLKKVIRQTVFSVSASNIRPVHTGVLFEASNDILTAVAIDTVRMALRTAIIEDTGLNSKFIVPGNTLREVLKLLKDENDVDILVSDKHCMFDFGEFKVITRLLEGEFLNYKPLLSTINNIEVIVETKEFCDSLERASLLINDDSSQKNERVPVRLNIGYDKMEINCITSKGRIHDVIPVQFTGDAIEIGFNYRLMLDALKASEDETVKLEMSGPHGSCFIKSIENSEYIYIVQPVRLYS